MALLIKFDDKPLSLLSLNFSSSIFHVRSPDFVRSILCHHWMSLNHGYEIIVADKTGDNFQSCMIIRTVLVLPLTISHS